LSRDGTVSCRTCHLPEHGFADPRAVSVGVAGHAGTRNSQTLLNAVYFESFGWTGEHPSLEAQTLAAMRNPEEMALGEALPPDVLRDHGAQLEALYGGADLEGAAAAIASYQRTLVAGASRFDRWIYGAEDVISESEKRGFEVYLGRARCVQCHFMRSPASHPFGGENGLYSDGRFHNIGVGFGPGAATIDPGRFEVTNRSADYGAFKTPSLRNVELTAPYMHDGSLRTLEEVVEHYDKGGEPNPNLDPDIQPLKLTDQEKADLVAFMKALTSGSPPATYGTTTIEEE
ncbi:MAG TPA: cytochrome c peroxidase, partial [Nocardioides sp.]|nr:cytochrome c peroxidase [Nocardioides sp.]